MLEFLFIFGYESPDERRSNLEHGTDFESSKAIWVIAHSKQRALEIGKQYAEKWVADLFVSHGIADYEGWLESRFAHWIEDEPEHRFPTADLTKLVRIEDH
jgi:hypothetical protein